MAQNRTQGMALSWGGEVQANLLQTLAKVMSCIVLVSISGTLQRRVFASLSVFEGLSGQETFFRDSTVFDIHSLCWLQSQK